MKPENHPLLVMFQPMDLHPYVMRSEITIREAEGWLVERLFQRERPVISQEAIELLLRAVKRASINWENIYVKYIDSLKGNVIPASKEIGVTSVPLLRNIIYCMVTDASMRDLSNSIILMEENVSLPNVLKTVMDVNLALQNIVNDVTALL